MEALLTAVGSVATACLTQVSSIFGLVTTQPVLQIGLGIFVVGACVGLVTRVIRAF